MLFTVHKIWQQMCVMGRVSCSVLLILFQRDATTLGHNGWVDDSIGACYAFLCVFSWVVLWG